MAWNRCSACDSPERIAIENQISTGVSLQLLAERFGGTEDIMRRHRDEHMNGQAFVVVQSSAEVMHVEMDPAAVFEETDRCAKEAQELIAYSRGAKNEFGEQTRLPDTKGWALGIREWRGCCEQKAKMMGMYDQVDPRLQGNHLNKMVNVLAKALESMPEAKEKVLDALKQLEQNG